MKPLALIVLSVVSLLGCVGTQTRNAFTPKHAALEWPDKPNHADDATKRLVKAIDDSISRQELLDRVREDR